LFVFFHHNLKVLLLSLFFNFEVVLNCTYWLITAESLAQRKLGKIRASLFKRRLDDLKSCATLEDARNLPGKYHELTGDRKGEWSCNLDHPNRLIFTAHETPIPIDSDGRYLWIEITGIEVIEITDYH